jgi:hypothetical protein
MNLATAIFTTGTILKIISLLSAPALSAKSSLGAVALCRHARLISADRILGILKLKHIPYIGRRIGSLNRYIRLSGFRPDIFDSDEDVRCSKSPLDFGRARARLDGVLHFGTLSGGQDRHGGPAGIRSLAARDVRAPGGSTWRGHFIKVGVEGVAACGGNDEMLHHLELSAAKLAEMLQTHLIRGPSRLAL